MPDPIVHITAGIPDSGTGNITTLGQTLTDGANVTIGATTDAAVTAGAAGTVNAHLRSISRDIVGGVVLQPGTNVIGHVVVDSGTVIVTQATGTNLHTVIDSGTISLPALASTSTKQSDGSQKTQIVDGSGNVIASTSNSLNVAITSGGGSGGTASSFGATFPATGTAIGVKNGANMVNLIADASGNLGVFQATGTNLHTVVDSGSITANAGTNLNTSALALESGGNLAAIKTDTDKILSSATNITAGAAVATTSFVIGTRYLSAPPTFTNGQEGALQIDANGKLLVAGSFSATPAVNTFTHISTSTTTNGIKSGAGTLSRIVINQTGTVASLITVYDNTTATGTVIAIIDGLSRTGNYDYECAFTTGLSIITTGTAAPDITVVWR